MENSKKFKVEELNLEEILKDCPLGTQLYSLMYGSVYLQSVQEGNVYPIITRIGGSDRIAAYTKEGKAQDNYPDAECLLYPSKDCRDWSKFQTQSGYFKKNDHVIWRTNNNEYLGVFDKYVEKDRCVIRLLHGAVISDWDVDTKDLTKIDKFDPNLLQPGDAVLVRYDNSEEWFYAQFSHLAIRNSKVFSIANCNLWKKSIPYNAETKHLVGKTSEAPSFYNY